MVRIALLAAVAAAAAGQTTEAPTGTNTWKMTKVNTIQARVQADAATWNEQNKKFGLVLKQHTETFELQRQAAMDTVNTASVEGALYYVQTEGIDKTDTAANCLRKNNMSYIWFLNITIVQPTFTIAQYADNGGVVPEYGKFVAMDKGMCTPIDTKGTKSSECLDMWKFPGHPTLGPYIGGEARKKHEKGDYADNYWFSFPNSCFLSDFDHKDDKCRENWKGGLCPIGTEPDGVTCTFSFDVLGYISIDDLVGVTNATNAAGKKYRDRFEFCKDSKIEYDFKTKKSDLTFWDEPLDPKANANRTEAMIKLYNNILKNPVGDQKHMKPFPDLQQLTDSNPPCWKNSPLCATAPNGCRRKLMAQICEVCDSPAADCKKPGPNDKVPPKLVKAPVIPLPTDKSGKTLDPNVVNNPGGATGSASSVALASTAAMALVALLL